MAHIGLRNFTDVLVWCELPTGSWWKHAYISLMADTGKWLIDKNKPIFGVIIPKVGIKLGFVICGRNSQTGSVREK